MSCGAIALWILLMILPPGVFSGRLPTWILAVELPVFALFVAVIERDRATKQRSRAARNALAGTAAAVGGTVLWLLAQRPGECALYSFVIGVILTCAVWMLFFAIAAVVERHVK
jgi:hypothetical protein